MENATCDHQDEERTTRTARPQACRAGERKAPASLGDMLGEDRFLVPNRLEAQGPSSLRRSAATPGLCLNTENRGSTLFFRRLNITGNYEYLAWRRKLRVAA